MTIVTGPRIVKRRLKGAFQNLRPQIGMRLQIPMFAEHDELCVAGRLPGGKMQKSRLMEKI